MNKKLVLVLSVSLLVSGLVQAVVVFPGGNGVAPAVKHKAGSVDLGFSTNGYYTDTPGDRIYAMKIQTDEKILIAGDDDSGNWRVVRLNKNGLVDGSFATNGAFSHSNGDRIYVMDIQSDGKILIAGDRDGDDWYLGRLNTDGSVDTDFATNGYFTHAAGHSVRAIAIQPDGKILIGGYFNASADFNLVRLNTDGSVDTDFATSGFYSKSDGEKLRSISVLSNGKIIISGNDDSNDWYVGRLNADGSEDTSFATSGFYTKGTGNIVYAMQIQSDGKIVLAGDKTGSYWYVGRLNADGSVDTSFATSGFYTNEDGGTIYEMQIQSDGKIVIAGDDNSTNNWYVGRLNADGSVDTSFATSGFHIDTSGNVVRAMELQSDGRVILGGDDDSDNWLVSRLVNDVDSLTQAASLNGGGIL